MFHCVQKAQVIGEAALPLIKLEAMEHLMRHIGGKGHRRLGIERHTPNSDAPPLVFDGGIAEEAVIPREKLSLQADLFLIVQGKGVAVIAGVQRGKIQPVQLFRNGVVES